MKVFVVGSQGQLGQTLVETVPDAIDFAGADLPELDIVDRGALEARFAAEQPGFVVNAAAYTAVDKAESEPDVARRINVDGARNVAQAAREAGARVIHISTSCSTAARPSLTRQPIRRHRLVFTDKPSWTAI
jgi:dTDP-4-dehydrorhamnose reductase